MLKLNETQIPQNYSTALYNDKGFDLMSSHTDKIVDVLFTGVTTCLADIKNLRKSVFFFGICDLCGYNGKEILGGIGIKIRP